MSDEKPKDAKDPKDPKDGNAEKQAKDPAAEKQGKDRRTSRRNPIQVRLEMSDTRGKFTGRSVDVSRGGLFAATAETRGVGTLLRIRVLGPRGDSVLAVGVVVRCFSDLEGGSEGHASPGLAIALTSTSEAWDRFWEDVSATDDLDLDDEDEDADDVEDLL